MRHYRTMFDGHDEQAATRRAIVRAAAALAEKQEG